MDTTSLSDSEWLMRAFDERYDHIYSYLSRRVGTDVAEDLASEVFAVAAKRRHAFDATRGSVAGWLFGIASNLIHTHQRSERRRLRAYVRHGASDVTGDPWDGVANDLDSAWNRGRIAQALSQLKVSSRDVLLLAAWTDLTYVEIADALDVPVGTVRSRLSRAKEEMRELIGQSGQELATSSGKDITWIA